MNKTPFWIIFFFLVAVCGAAESAPGIHFEDGLTWSQVQAKAKAEDKMIFMDCYATWCAPCKAMDQDVYPKPEVGAYFNDHFISVKVQMNETRRDSEQVLAWRSDATQLSQDYKIGAYPTYLFFSSEGKAVHKAMGGKSPRELIQLAKDAGNSQKQYYTLLERYQSAKDYTVAAKLVQAIHDLDGQEASKAFAFDYIENYLAKQSEAIIATQENLELAFQYRNDAKDHPVFSSSGTIFQAAYHKLHGAGERDVSWDEARFLVDAIITQEEIDPKLWQGKGKARKVLTDKPDWEVLYNTMAAKYSATDAQRNLLHSQYGWFDDTKDYEASARAWLDFLALDGVIIKDGIYSQPDNINQRAWLIVFEHCTDHALLERTSALMQEAVGATNPDSGAWCQYADTLANLLYKAGRTQEGVEWETQAAERSEALATAASAKSNRQINPDPTFRKSLEKMKQGLPTWGRDDRPASNRRYTGAIRSRMRNNTVSPHVHESIGASALAMT